VDAALGWVGQIVDWLAQFIPRRVIIEATHGGVKFVGGDEVIELGPGVHWYWPFWTTLHQHPMVRQTVDLRSQVLITTDSKTIVVGGLVTYDVRDIKTLMVTVWNTDQTIRDVALTALHDRLARMSWIDIRREQSLGVLNKLLREAVRKELEKYGVRVLKVALTDLAPARVFRHIQSTAQDGDGLI
jgi:regulator of protease activity HflC (stomatin/prohibitin superfamily)